MRIHVINIPLEAEASNMAEMKNGRLIIGKDIALRAVRAFRRHAAVAVSIHSLFKQAKNEEI